MTLSLHPLIGNLINLNRHDANARIDEWLGTKPNIEDLRYVSQFLQNRERSNGNQVRVGMAALYVALLSFGAAFFAGFSTTETAVPMLQLFAVVFGAGSLGLIYTLVMMLVEVVQSKNDAKLLARVQLTLELSRRKAPESTKWSRSSAQRMFRGRSVTVKIINV
ncbi:hypothetical protein HWD99_06875 [Microbacterium sp. C5A9]|uniref:hypothetical protein n=1 Tax=Microbacterium sp. C5A9 TaxID=2736663 RepID=UPI001F526C2E|nr:hypothetical protein [Microbacterium sp. C5A9]MCI1018339.1 hypothetical protein [Microbacterium sp. C5A9]